MLTSELPTGGVVPSEITSEISALFEGGMIIPVSTSKPVVLSSDLDTAAKQVKTQVGGGQKQEVAGQFTSKEIEWFACNSYNTALRHFGDCSPHHMVTLFAASEAVSLLLHSSGFGIARLSFTILIVPRTPPRPASRT